MKKLYFLIAFLLLAALIKNIVLFFSDKIESQYFAKYDKIIDPIMQNAGLHPKKIPTETLGIGDFPLKPEDKNAPWKAYSNADDRLKVLVFVLKNKFEINSYFTSKLFQGETHEYDALLKNLREILWKTNPY